MRQIRRWVFVFGAFWGGSVSVCGACEFNDCAECEERVDCRPCCCGDLGPSEEDIAEERLRARDYEAWADL